MIRDDEGVCRVGDPIPEPRPLVFELDVAALVPTVAGIDPARYFITSGDAVSKALILQRDLKRKLQQQPDQELERAVAAAGYLVQQLQLVRGDAVFLETEHVNHRLLCIPKNPRRREI